MTSQFKWIGIPFERVSAIDGEQPDIAAEAAMIGADASGKQMSANAFACFQSHRLVWEKLVASNESHAMVFEDDLVLVREIASYMDSKWIPEDADLIKLDTLETRVHVNCRQQIGESRRSLSRMRSRHVGAGCYVISASIARFLIIQTEKIVDPVDEFLFNESSAVFRRLTTYQMDPAPAIQGDRLGSETAPASWTVSSIKSRVAGKITDIAPVKKPKLSRLLERTKEEIRALKHGTKYVVIQHG